MSEMKKPRGLGGHRGLDVLFTTPKRPVRAVVEKRNYL